MSGAPPLESWAAEARALSAAHAALRRDARIDERPILCQLDDLLRRAPTPVQIAMRRMPERELRDRAAARCDAISVADFAWEPAGGDAAPPEDWGTAAFAQVRAWDEYLYRFGGPASGPGADWRVPGTSVFLIPRGERRAKTASPTANTHPYSRRSTLYHAIVPTFTAGIEIVPVEAPTRVSRHPLDPAALRLGAALFEEARPAFATSERAGRPPAFHATHLAVGGTEEVLSSQLAGAVRDRCFAAVWPELTMPPEARRILLERLEDLAFDGALGEDVEIFVLGSWHRAEGGVIVNATEVCGREGTTLLEHLKIFPYESDRDGDENIRSGTKVHVLVFPGLLVSFGICKDFCEGALPNIFAQLPVDLVLVPSMGPREMMQEHLASGKHARLATGASVFVVQQDQGDAAGKFGFVLATTGKAGLPKAGSGPRRDDLRQDGPWDAYG